MELVVFENLLMNVTNTSSTPQEESSIDWWQRVLDTLGVVGTILTICGILFAIALFIVFFARSRKKNVNRISCERIDSNIKSKKYISNVYVEMDETQETLRSFCLSKIRKQYFKELSCFYKSYAGSIIKKYLGIFTLANITKNQKLKNAQRIIDFLEHLNQHKRRDDKYTYIFDYLLIHYYRHSKYLQRLVRHLELKPNVIVLGKAASGKTNLLVNFAKQTLMGNKQEVVYIDSKYIANNLEEEFVATFNKSNEYTDKTKFFLKIHLLLKSIFRRKIFVVIDALNENEDKDFKKQLVSFFNKYNRYSNIKIIASCRSEFFNLRFADHFHGIHKGFTAIHITGIEDGFTRKQFFNKYRNYFNYTGDISDSIERSVCKSPILIRIFFELHENSSKNAEHFTVIELLSKYINQLQDKIPEIVNVLNFVATTMVSQNNFEHVDYDLVINEFGPEVIERLINESFLVRRDEIKTDEGINHYKKVLSISYDEIRDFIIFDLYVNKKIELAFNSEFAALEGVLRYLYLYFKDKNQISGITKVLFYIAKHDHFRAREDLFSLILPLIIESEYNPTEIEKQFVLHAMIYNHDGLRIGIEGLLGNTILGKHFNFDFVIENSDKFNYHNLSQSYFRSLIEVFGKKPNITEKHIQFLKKLIDDNRDSKMNEYDLYDIFECNSNYYFVRKNQIISYGKMIKDLGIYRYSFFGRIFKRVHSHMYSGLIKLSTNYISLYKKEFETPYDYSVSVLRYDCSGKDVKSISFKNRMSFFDSCTEVILEDETIFNKMKESVG